MIMFVVFVFMDVMYANEVCYLLTIYFVYDTFVQDTPCKNISQCYVKETR